MRYPWLRFKYLSNNDLRMISPIIILMMRAFDELFIDDFEKTELCELLIDPSSPCPMLITNFAVGRVVIRLNIQSTRNWCQLIYQLSHELCHYFIRQKKNKVITVKWIEETFCEAASLFVLDYFSKNWSQSHLSRLEQGYNKSINEYLDKQLSISFEELLPNCKSIEQFKIIESTSEENRSWRINERNQLYAILVEHPADFNCVLDYTEYLQKDCTLLMDIELWSKQYENNHIIEFIEKIQPKIQD